MISTISPGGFSAKAAAATENPMIAVLVHSNSLDDEAKGATRFLYRVEAATSNTLSIDDMAAARIDTIKKSVAQSGNTAASFTRDGTIRSVSVTSGSMRWA